MSKVARSAAKWRLVTRLLGLPRHGRIEGTDREFGRVSRERGQAIFAKSRLVQPADQPFSGSRSLDAKVGEQRLALKLVADDDSLDAIQAEGQHGVRLLLSGISRVGGPGLGLGSRRRRIGQFRRRWRQRYRVHDQRGGCRILVVLDRPALVGGAGQAADREVEIELKKRARPSRQILLDQLPSSRQTIPRSIQLPPQPPGTNTRTLFAGMTIVAECGIASVAGPVASTEPPFPTTCGFG